MRIFLGSSLIKSLEDMRLFNQSSYSKDTPGKKNTSFEEFWISKDNYFKQKFKSAVGKPTRRIDRKSNADNYASKTFLNERHKLSKEAENKLKQIRYVRWKPPDGRVFRTHCAGIGSLRMTNKSTGLFSGWTTTSAASHLSTELCQTKQAHTTSLLYHLQNVPDDSPTIESAEKE